MADSESPRLPIRRDRMSQLKPYHDKEVAKMRHHGCV